MADKSADEGTCAYPQGPNLKPAIMLVVFLVTVLTVMYWMPGGEGEKVEEKKKVVDGEQMKRAE